MERQRKQTTAQKRKSQFAAPAALKGNPLKVLQPTRKKGMALKGILAKLLDEGFYIVSIRGNRVVRCSCNQKIISGGNRDYCSILKHVETTKKHLEYIEQRKLSQLKDTQLFNAVSEEPNVI
jgi:hypothetical protein